MKKTLLPLLLALPALAWPGQDAERTAPKLDKPAPTFRLNTHEAEVRKVGGPQKHWSVLAFFPKAMTPG